MYLYRVIDSLGSIKGKTFSMNFCSKQLSNLAVNEAGGGAGNFPTGG